MEKRTEQVQVGLCENLIAEIRTDSDTPAGEITGYKCKYYGVNPPPCHATHSAYFVEMQDCKHNDYWNAGTEE